MQIGTNYTNTVSQTSKVNQTSPYAQNKNKIDYSNYSAKDIRNISYEEAKTNYSQIKERLENLGKENLSNEDRKEFLVATLQLEKTNLSDNDKLNKALYQTMSDEDNSANALMMDSEIMTNLQDFYYGKPINASFVVSNNEIHSSENLTKSQLNSINFDEFISKMLQVFSEDLSQTTGSIKEQYNQIINGYKSFQGNYEKSVKEPYYA